MRFFSQILFGMILALTNVSGGHAQDLAQNSNQEFDFIQDFGLSEFRAGLFYHSIDDVGPGGVGNTNFTRPGDINFEALFKTPELDVFYWIGSPRPTIGANINTGGLESFIRLGLTWHLPIFDTPFYLEGQFGGALHNGDLKGAVFPRRNLGCSLMFYESAGVGVNIGDNLTVTGVIEHSSTANICLPNRGLTNLGVKIGYRF